MKAQEYSHTSALFSDEVAPSGDKDNWVYSFYFFHLFSPCFLDCSQLPVSDISVTDPESLCNVNNSEAAVMTTAMTGVCINK